MLAISVSRNVSIKMVGSERESDCGIKIDRVSAGGVPICVCKIYYSQDVLIQNE